MLASLIAERYAKALLRAARADKALAEVGAQAETLRLALAGARDSAPFLSDPVAESQAKLRVLSSVFPGGPHPIVQSFLLAVLELKRERFLPVILSAFARMREEAEGRATVAVGTARSLPAAERKVLEEALSGRLGRTVTLNPYTDQSLLGGAVFKVGDTVYDGSLRGSLTRLGRRLAEDPVARPKAEAAQAPAVRKPESAKKKPAAVKAAKKAPEKKKTAKKSKP